MAIFFAPLALKTLALFNIFLYLSPTQMLKWGVINFFHLIIYIYLLLTLSQLFLTNVFKRKNGPKWQYFNFF